MKKKRLKKDILVKLVIVIFTILFVGIFIMSVCKYIERVKMIKEIEKFELDVEKAADKYIKNNKILEEERSITINYVDLLDNKLIKEKDSKNYKCLGGETYVIVTKDKDKYHYCVHLNCINKNNLVIYKSKDKGPYCEKIY